MSMIKHRIRGVFIISFLLTANQLFGQANGKIEIIQTVLEIMEEHSVNALENEWESLRLKYLEKVSMDSSDNYLVESVIELLSLIKDFHGAFYYRDQIYKWNHNQIEVSDSIMNEWKKGAKVTSVKLDKDIGYLRIPSMPFVNKEDSDAKAQELNDQLCDLLQSDMKGLIIDLRLNGGGAMYPMILGVQQLLPKGQIGSFQSKNNEKWFLTDTEFSINEQVLASIQPRCSINGQNIPTVLLISPVTGSSAEFFIIALKSRQNTVLLGSSTAGYITATEGFPISDSAFLLLSTAYGVDINGLVYKSAFEPDFPFESLDSFNDIPNDKKVIEAMTWLKKKVEL